MSDWIKAVTNAPLDYDWGWTRLLADNYAEAKGLREPVIRLVEVDTLYRANYQVGRYHSGLYFAMLHDEFLAEMQQHPDYFWLTPDKTVWYHRETLQFPGIADWRNKAIDHFLTVYDEVRRRSGMRIETGEGGLTLHLTFRGDEGGFQDAIRTLNVAAEQAQQIHEGGENARAVTQVT